jgi:hypothetical protein
MNHATVSPLVPVAYSYRPDMGLEFLTLDVPNGWDDVKKLTNKTLSFHDKTFTFSGWNSDSLKCYFSRSTSVAAIN